MNHYEPKISREKLWKCGMASRREHSAMLVFVVGVLALIPVASAQTGNTSTADWQALQLTSPRWVTSNQLVGPMDTSQAITVQVHLRMHHPAQAAAQFTDITNPKSPNYRHYLTDAQFEAAYGPTPAEVKAVTDHLAAHGMVVTYVPNNRAFVSATGSVAAANRAFGTQIGLYGVNNQIKRAPMTAPRLPKPIAPAVLTVLGLHEPVVMRSHRVTVADVRQQAVLKGKVVPASAFGGLCSEWFGQIPDLIDPPYFNYPPLTEMPCPYLPPQLRKAYGLEPLVQRGNDGTGVKVAIVDAFLSPTLLQDAQTYAARNDPQYPLHASQFSAVMAPGNPQPVDTGWYSEQSLDVEAVHALAPGANIVYVGAQSATDQDLDAALNYIVDHHLATIISNSWGSPEVYPNNFVAFNAFATQAGLKGVGVYFSSGDNGDESLADIFGMISADFPASSDKVTAVGGTSMAINQQGGRFFEAAWATGASFLQPTPGGVGLSWQPGPPGVFIFGGGGGVSNVYSQPWWQKDVVPEKIAYTPGVPARAVPDVAMDADPFTGFLIGMTGVAPDGGYGEGGIGGTSLACPLFAATMALAEQSAREAIGFANPTLYDAVDNQSQVGAVDNQSQVGAFIDIVPLNPPRAVEYTFAPGIVVTFDAEVESLVTAPGYDTLTGLGVPNGNKFVDAVAHAGKPGAPPVCNRTPP